MYKLVNWEKCLNLQDYKQLVTDTANKECGTTVDKVLVFNKKYLRRDLDRFPEIIKSETIKCTEYGEIGTIPKMLPFVNAIKENIKLIQNYNCVGYGAAVKKETKNLPLPKVAKLTYEADNQTLEMFPVSYSFNPEDRNMEVSFGELGSPAIAVVRKFDTTNGKVLGKDSRWYAIKNFEIIDYGTSAEIPGFYQCNALSTFNYAKMCKENNCCQYASLPPYIRRPQGSGCSYAR